MDLMSADIPVKALAKDIFGCFQEEVRNKGKKGRNQTLKLLNVFLLVLTTHTTHQITTQKSQFTLSSWPANLLMVWFFGK